jgi:hypothetical protein
MRVLPLQIGDRINMKKPRNSDGSIRNSNTPKLLKPRSEWAGFVEAECLHLKRWGMSFQAIADHIGAVARGERPPLVPIPEGVSLPKDHRISAQGVHRAFKRGIARLPNAEAAELRKLDTERLEDFLFSLQSGIRQGEARSIEVAAKLLALKAEINGYKSPTRLEMKATNRILVEHQAAEAQARADLERLSVDELREYRRLEAKARGLSDETETAAILKKRRSNGNDDPDDAEG